MWVMYDTKTFDVFRSVHTYALAKRLLDQYVSGQPTWVRNRYAIEKIKTGSLESWLMWKKLTGKHDGI